MTSRPCRESTAEPASISVVIPIHDEVENLERLVAALDASVPPLGREYEYVLVDDGSTDGSTDLLDQLAAGRPDIVPVHLRRCFGQTAALDAGIRTSHGDVIVLLDADLQNDPADIPLMIARLDEGYDVVHGWRASRQDRFWSRRLPSVAANRLIRWVTGVKVGRGRARCRCGTMPAPTAARNTASPARSRSRPICSCCRGSRGWPCRWFGSRSARVSRCWPRRRSHPSRPASPPSRAGVCRGA
jgi:hypothetical protein